jgi:1,4-alpha-glucan branching enzyme
MGGELGQSAEWNANGELDWWLMGEGPYHRGIQRFIEDLNKLYRADPALWERDYDLDGFYWIDCTDTENSVMSFVRQSADQKSRLLVVLNLTPVLRTGYRIGLPVGGFWKEALNSDAGTYAGGNHGNLGGVHAEPHSQHGQPCSALITLPPMSAVVFKHQG